jgi:hypothetical protein
MTKFKIPYRLILSVMAGIAIAAVFSVLTHLLLYAIGVSPPPFKPMFDKQDLIISLCYHSAFAIAGAFVTAWIARKQARKAVFILGSKEAIMWVLGMILLWHHSPPWFNITKAVLGPPLAWFGGKLYQLYKKKHDGQHVKV